MADNLIEQFFIDIELNTKGVGKQAKEIDKMLDNLGVRASKRERARDNSKKRNRIRNERDIRDKESQLAQKALVKRLNEHKKEKQSKSKLNKKEVDEYYLVEKAKQKIDAKRAKRELDLAKINHKIKTARIKQQVKSITQGNPELSAMRDYYKKQGATVKSVVKPDKEPIVKSDHPSKLKNERIRAEKAFRDREAQLAQKALNTRLVIFKKQKAASSLLEQKELDRLRKIEAARTKQHAQRMTQQNQELRKMKEFYKAQEKASERAAKRQKVIDNQMARIQGTAWYNKFKSSGGDTHGFEKDLRSAMKDGDAAKVTNLTNKMKRLTAEQDRYNRSLKKTNIVQRGVADSTRNMIRSYASLYALFEGTVAIKRIGQDYQGLEASMLAAAGSTDAAAKDFEFINGMVDQMGLSLKDTTDAWVKFKFAAKGKISQEQQEDVFTGLSMFGTALKVDSESMKRSQKALIQIDDYCLAA